MEQPTFRYWNISNGGLLVVVTTPDSVTITHQRDTKALDQAYQAGTLRQLVESDRKLKKATVFYPSEVAYIPGNGKLWITDSSGNRRHFNSDVFSNSGESVASFISGQLMAQRPAQQVSLREFPKLRRPWVLFPLGMGAFVVAMIGAIRAIASTYGAGDRRPIIAEALLSIPIWALAAACVALLGLAAIQTSRRAVSDQPLLVYS